MMFIIAPYFVFTDIIKYDNLFVNLDKQKAN